MGKTLLKYSYSLTQQFPLVGRHRGMKRYMCKDIPCRIVDDREELGGGN